MATAATLTGAELLLQAAVEEGIEVCFANPGTSEMHFVSALDTVWGVRPVLGLHETVCSGAADGYARMKGKPALTLLHLGPGLANALANMHNAHRASTPMVNLIGDMATWHKPADPLLNMDIPALAHTVSKTVICCTEDDDLRARMAQACHATKSAEEVGGSRISTIIVPHNLSWERAAAAGRSSSKHRQSPRQSSGLDAAVPPQQLSPATGAFLSECAGALKACPRGKAAVYIGGRGALADSGALQSARIATALGAALYCENSFARLDRGAGLPAVARLPYFPQDAASTLAAFKVLLLVDVRRPVANFGYHGGPSQLILQPDPDVWELDSAEVDVAAALESISQAVGGAAVKPLVDCGGRFCPAARPAVPKGRLNPTALCQIVAALQPMDAIVVDESLTSGNAYWEASKGCPPFSHLTLTGGAIGCGPPLAVGTAVACPERTVINFQADGSAMYSLQALWTQARESLRVVTIVCANRVYAILKVEMAKQRIAPSNGPAAKALTDIGSPAIDWVSLAQGMGVMAARAETCEQLAEQLAAALDRQGPTLIEARI